MMATSGCVSRTEPPQGGAGHPQAVEPQVNYVLSPHFQGENFSRIAIVSTKFSFESGVSQPPYTPAGQQNFRNIDGTSPYRSGNNGQQSEASVRLSDQDSLALVIEDVFIRFLIGKGYSYASRKEVREIVNEQSFQHSGLTDSDAVRMGKLLNVPAVLMITVSNLGEVNTFDGNLLTLPFQLAGALLMPSRGASCLMRCSITARLIATQTGEVLWLASLNNFVLKQNNNDITPVLQRSTEMIAKSFPSKH